MEMPLIGVCFIILNIGCQISTRLFVDDFLWLAGIRWLMQIYIHNQKQTSNDSYSEKGLQQTYTLEFFRSIFFFFLFI